MEDLQLNGLYTITNIQSQTRLDLERGKKADGTKVLGWAPHQPTDGKAYGNQVWKIQPIRGEGLRTVYNITNVKTGTYLEAYRPVGDGGVFLPGDIEDGVQVTCSKAIVDEDWLERMAQEWQLFKDHVPAYPGTYLIYHSRSGLHMDVEGGASTNGAKIQIHCAHHDIGNFKELFWTIEPTEYPHPQSGAQTTVDTMPADAEASQKDA